MIFVLATLVYILNVFVISPDTGSVALLQKEGFAAAGIEMPNPLFLQILGYWGGHLNDLLGYNVQNVLAGELWRIYTVVLTHGFLFHYLLNMIALLIAGNHIEKKYGTLKTVGLFAVLTLLSNLITDLVFFYFLGNETAISYGASGWITVTMGMIAAKCFQKKGYLKQEFKTSSVVYLIAYFVSTTFIFMPNMFTITAHIGGLILGVAAELIIHKVHPDTT